MMGDEVIARMKIPPLFPHTKPSSSSSSIRLLSLLKQPDSGSSSNPNLELDESDIKGEVGEANALRDNLDCLLWNDAHLPFTSCRRYLNKTSDEELSTEKPSVPEGASADPVTLRRRTLAAAAERRLQMQQNS